MSNMHVKKGDKILVLAGKDKGKISEVLSVNPKENTVVAANVNIVVHHNKPKSREEKGGIVKAPASIDASNVQVVCPACNKATRIAHKKDETNKSVRICKKCGPVLDSKFKQVKDKKVVKASKDAKTAKASEKPEKVVKLEKVDKVEKTQTVKKAAKPKTTAEKTTTTASTKTATTKVAAVKTEAKTASAKTATKTTIAKTSTKKADKE